MQSDKNSIQVLNLFLRELFREITRIEIRMGHLNSPNYKFIEITIVLKRLKICGC